MSRNTPSPPRGALKGFGLNSRVSLVSAATGSIRRAGKQVRKLVKPKSATTTTITANALPGATTNFKPLQWLTTRFRKAPKPEELPDTAVPPSPSVEFTSNNRPTIVPGVEDSDADNDSIGDRDTVSSLSQLSFYFPRADHPSSFLDMDSDDESHDKEEPEIESMEALELFQTLSSIRIPRSADHQGHVQPLRSRTYNSASQPFGPSLTAYTPGIGIKPIVSPFFISVQRLLPPENGFGIRARNERIKTRHIRRQVSASYFVPTRRDDWTANLEPWIALVHILPRWVQTVGRVRRHVRAPPNTVQFPMIPHLDSVRDAVVLLSMGALPLCRLLFG